jgi:coatomer protein complex subunit alpha (xenin)
VANILSSDTTASGAGAADGSKEDKQEKNAVEEATLENLDGAQWGDDEEPIDIDMGEDLAPTAEDGAEGKAAEGTQEGDVFVPPAHGANPISQALKKNPQNAGLHVAAGEFSKALGLLRQQLGITDYAPFKQLFVDVYTLSKVKMQTMPHTSPLDYRLRFIDQPIVCLTLQMLQKMFTKGKEMTTQGDFVGAILAFRNCLQSIPLLAVTSDQALADVKKLTALLVEYITAMRVEIERKRLLTEKSDDTVRMAELSCYMTLCGMDKAHKFLVYKNALQNNYKIQNFITAAHFARAILDLEPTGLFANKPDVIS